ncbi:hypothetical protein WB897_003121 [Vibrio vulnificus]|nr:hypothetical protein [Vibrio vulnificus]HAS8387697.1 hypothetical protein [Vibrio vulnificus]
MVYKFVRFSVFFCFLLVSTFLKGEERTWVVGKSGNEVTFGGKGYVDKSEYSLPIIKIKNTKSPIDVISNYFWRLKNGDIDGLEHLFFRKDGSFSTVKQMLESGGVDFTKFSNVESIKVVAVKKWGNLTSFDLKMFSKDGKSFGWQQNVVCDKKCSLVWNLFDKDSTSDMLELFLFSYLESEISYANSQKLIETTRFQRSLSLISKYGMMTENNGSPLIFSLNITSIVSESEINLDKCDEVKESLSIGFCDIYSKTKSLELNDLEMVKKHIFSIAGREDLEGLYVNRYAGDGVQSMFYGYFASAQFIRSWNKIHIIGVIKGKDTDIILFKPTNEENITHPIQALSYDKTSKKLFYGSNWDQNYLFFYNNIFSTELDVSFKL